MIKKIFILILLPFSLISQEKNAEYYANYASDSIGSGNFDLRLFVEYLTKAIELDSLNVDYYVQRSYALQNLGDQIKAIEDFDKIISIYEQDNRFKDLFDFEGNPYVFDFYAQKYYYLVKIGNLEDAIDAIDKAIYNLTYIIKTSKKLNQPKSEIRHYIDRLMELYESKGYSLLKAGRFDKRKKFF